MTIDDEHGPGSHARAAHVLIVVENVPLGVDQRVRKQVPTLLAAGHEVTVVTRADPSNAAWAALDGLTVLEHPMPPEPSGPLGYVREYAAAMRHAARLSLRAHRRRPVDVVQFCQPPDIYFPTAWVLRALGASVLIDQRDLMPEVFAARYGARGPMTAVLSWLERRSRRVAHHVVGVNVHLRDRLRANGPEPENVRIVRNGPVLARVDAAVADPARRGDAEVLVCWAGVIGRQDRVDLLVEAVDDLVHRRGVRGWRFAVLGDGECLAEIRADVRRRGLEPWVSTPGWLTEADLFTWLATADIGVDSSLQEEVSPVKVMEYLAFRLPVVAFDLPETAAVAADAGLLVRPGDTAALADALTELAADPRRRATLGAVGRSRAERELCWEHQSEVYRSVIDRALTGRAGSAGSAARRPVTT